MKNIYFLLSLTLSFFVFGQGLENFNNSMATSSYADDSFVGNDGITWSYVQSRDQNGDANMSGIDGNALMLRRASSSSSVTSSTITGGIGDFSVKLYKGFTGAGDRQVELLINGTSYGTSTAFDDFAEHTFEVTGINITGDVVISIVNTTEKQVIIDDISWTAPGTSIDPTINITAPSEGQVLDVGVTSSDVTFVTSNFVLGTDGMVKATLNGSDLMPTSLFATGDPITIDNLMPGMHTVKLQLVDMNENPLATDVFDEVNFEVPTVLAVANLATLRTQNADGTTLYILPSEAFINYAQSFRNQKFIQDDTAGILIDDSPGNITVGARGDGLTDIVGTLSTFNGMLQFVPVQDATLVSPSTLTITPQSVTLAELATNFEDYEAELVTIEPVSIDTTANTTFENGTDYVMTESTNNTDTFNFYTNFYDVDYITTTINTSGYSSITGLPFERIDGQRFVARDLADFVNLGVDDIDGLDNNVKLSNTIVTDSFTIYLDGKADVQLFNSNGQLISTANGNDEVLVNTSNLSTGVYFVTISQDGQTVTRKVIKQ